MKEKETGRRGRRERRGTNTGYEIRKRRGRRNVRRVGVERNRCLKMAACEEALIWQVYKAVS
jgi:hypothetical protein